MVVSTLGLGWRHGRIISSLVQELGCCRTHQKYGKSGKFSLLEEFQLQFPIPHVPAHPGAAEAGPAPGELSDYLLLTAGFAVPGDLGRGERLSLRYHFLLPVETAGGSLCTCMLQPCIIICIIYIIG